VGARENEEIRDGGWRVIDVGFWAGRGVELLVRPTAAGGGKTLATLNSHCPLHSRRQGQKRWNLGADDFLKQAFWKAAEFAATLGRGRLIGRSERRSTSGIIQAPSP